MKTAIIAIIVIVIIIIIAVLLNRGDTYKRVNIPDFKVAGPWSTDKSFPLTLVKVGNRTTLHSDGNRTAAVVSNGSKLIRSTTAVPEEFRPSSDLKFEVPINSEGYHHWITATLGKDGFLSFPSTDNNTAFGAKGAGVWGFAISYGGTLDKHVSDAIVINAPFVSKTINMVCPLTISKFEDLVTITFGKPSQSLPPSITETTKGLTLQPYVNFGKVLANFKPTWRVSFPLITDAGISQCIIENDGNVQIYSADVEKAHQPAVDVNWTTFEPTTAHYTTAV